MTFTETRDKSRNTNQIVITSHTAAQVLSTPAVLKEANELSDKSIDDGFETWMKGSDYSSIGQNPRSHT